MRDKLAQNALVVKEAGPDKLGYNIKEYRSRKVISSTKNCSSEITWKLIREYVRKHQGKGVSRKMSFSQKAQEAKEKGLPVYYEGDLICNICGEPWDFFGISHGDMTPEEARKFESGGGCPCCP